MNTYALLLSAVKFFRAVNRPYSVYLETRNEGYIIAMDTYCQYPQKRQARVILTREFTPAEYLKLTSDRRWGNDTFVVIENLDMINWSK